MTKKNKDMNRKIVKLSEISKENKKDFKNKTILVGGCFELFHFGHLTFLMEAKKHGDKLIIALEADEFIEKSKNRKPLHTQHQRAQILAHLEIVDKVILLPHLKTFEEYFELVKTVNPSVIAVTEGDKRLKEKSQQADSIGAQLKVVCTLVPASSTSKIIEYASIFGN